MAEGGLMSSRGRMVKLAPWATGAGINGNLAFRPSGSQQGLAFQELPDEDSDRTASPEPMEEEEQQERPRPPPSQQRRTANPPVVSKRGSVPVRDETGKFIGVRPKTAAERAQVGNTGGIFKNAAIEVLRQDLRLMSTGEIARTAIERQVIKCQGKTPEATMASALYTDVKRKEFNSIFIRPQEGLFGLREWITNGTMFEGMEQAGYAYHSPNHPLVPLPPVTQPMGGKRPYEGSYVMPSFYQGAPGQTMYYSVPAQGGPMGGPNYGLASQIPQLPVIPSPGYVMATSAPQAPYSPGLFTAPPADQNGPGAEKRRKLQATPSAQQQPEAETPGSAGATGQKEQGNIMLLIDAAEELSSQDSMGSADMGDGPGGMEGSSLGPRKPRLPRSRSLKPGQPQDARKVASRLGRSKKGPVTPFVPDLASLSVTGLGLAAARAQQPILLPGQQVAPANANIINMPLPDDIALIDTTPCEDFQPMDEPLEALVPGAPRGQHLLPEVESLLVPNVSSLSMGDPLALLEGPVVELPPPTAKSGASQPSSGSLPDTAKDGSKDGPIAFGSGETSSTALNPLALGALGLGNPLGNPLGLDGPSPSMDVESVQLLETNAELLERSLGRHNPQVGKSWLFLARIYSNPDSPNYNLQKGQQALQKAKDVVVACGHQDVPSSSLDSFAYLLQKPATPSAAAQAKPSASTLLA